MVSWCESENQVGSSGLRGLALKCSPLHPRNARVPDEISGLDAGVLIPAHKKLNRNLWWPCFGEILRFSWRIYGAHESGFLTKFWAVNVGGFQKIYFMTIASGNKISLARATLADRERVYQWFAHSDLTTRTMGPPVFTQHSVPSYETFCETWLPHYFDGTQPFGGRGFLIRVDDQDVGFIGHGPVDLFRDVVELHLWLASSEFTSKGLGSDALHTACTWLQSNLGVNRFLARPSRRNVHALRALRRAGFRETDLEPRAVQSRLELSPNTYGDDMLMFHVLDMPPARLEVQPGHTYVFVDSEFTNLTGPHLISVGAVATDATAFYCELSDFPVSHCSAFVRNTVLPLLDGDAVPHAIASQSLAQWLSARSAAGPVVLISDSGFDRWAVADLLGCEDLPAGVRWVRVPVKYELLDDMARRLGLRRHHALDDARALRHAVLRNEKN